MLAQLRYFYIIEDYYTACSKEPDALRIWLCLHTSNCRNKTSLISLMVYPIQFPEQLEAFQSSGEEEKKTRKIVYFGLSALLT